MLISVLLGVLVLATPDSQECADVASCRQAALDVASRGDFETFHDLAWRAAQKGRPNDPDLMALVARAQSLSGRPGDALVMLRRLAQIGANTDAATSDDFRRVRALPGWPEVEALLKSGGKAADESGLTGAVGRPTATALPAATALTRSAPDVKPSAPEASASAAIEEEVLPLASIQPAGLVHDAVSRRFIVGDRGENKLVIFDEVFKRATDMVGADSAGFFGLAALEIDPRRGDLWVANSTAVRGASLHKLQLVSGRVLFELPVPAELGPTAFVDLAVLLDGHVLLLDAQGRRILEVAPGRRAFERTARADVEAATSLASAGGRTAYVAHRDGILRVDLDSGTSSSVAGAPPGLLRIRADGRMLVAVQSTTGGTRILGIRLDATGRRVSKVDVLDAAAEMLDPSAITIADGLAYYIVLGNGAPVMRRVKVGK